MIRLLTFVLFTAVPCSAAVTSIKSVTISIPGTGASIPGYAISPRNQNIGLSMAFNSLAGPITAGRGAYFGESWRLTKMLVESVQKIAPRISDNGVAMVKLGPTLILMPRYDKDRNLKTKIAVIEVGDNLTYLSTTMRDLATAYEKVAANERFDVFGPAMFDGGKRQALPGIKKSHGTIPLGPKTGMRPSAWNTTKQHINDVAARTRP